MEGHQNENSSLNIHPALNNHQKINSYPNLYTTFNSHQKMNSSPNLHRPFRSHNNENSSPDLHPSFENHQKVNESPTSNPASTGHQEVNSSPHLNPAFNSYQKVNSSLPLNPAFQSPKNVTRSSNLQPTFNSYQNASSSQHWHPAFNSLQNSYFNLHPAFNLNAARTPLHNNQNLYTYPWSNVPQNFPPHCATCTCHLPSQQKKEDLEHGGYLDRAVMAYTLTRVNKLDIKGAKDSEAILKVIQEVYEKFPMVNNTPENKKCLRNKISKQASNQHYKRIKRNTGVTNSDNVKTVPPANQDDCVILQGYNSDDDEVLDLSHTSSIQTTFSTVNSTTVDILTSTTTALDNKTEKKLESSNSTPQHPTDRISNKVGSPILVEFNDSVCEPQPSNILSVFDFAITPKRSKTPTKSLVHRLNLSTEKQDTLVQQTRNKGKTYQAKRRVSSLFSDKKKLINVSDDHSNHSTSSVNTYPRTPHSPESSENQLSLTDPHKFNRGSVVVAEYVNQTLFIAKCTIDGLMYAKVKCGSKKTGIKISAKSLEFNKRDIQPEQSVQKEYLHGIIPAHMYHFEESGQSIIPVDNERFKELLQTIKYSSD